MEPQETNNSLDIYNKICKLLNDNGIQYRTLQHEPTFTSEQAAKYRGESLDIGGKAILMKINDTFHLFVFSASKKINSKALKSCFNTKKIRFATSDELMTLCNLVPGSVPPFGEPIFANLKLFVDKGVLQNEKIAFNAGSLTNSIIMNMNDYLKVASPNVIEFAE